jgi:flagellar motor switch protein FliN/FliY
MEIEANKPGKSSELGDDAALTKPSLELLKDIELPMALRFGRARMSLRDLAGLETGAIIELDRALKDRIELLVGGHVVALGEPVVVDGTYGIRISEIVSRRERLMSTSLPGADAAGNAQ